MSNGIGRTQNVGKTPNQGVMGEMGRTRVKFQPREGMRAVKIFKGSRDNFDDTIQHYLDEDGPIQGAIVHETANSVIVEYPEENFKRNQAQAENKAIKRVAVANPVEAQVSQNSVGAGKTASLDELIADAKADEAKRSFDQ